MQIGALPELASGRESSRSVEHGGSPVGCRPGLNPPRGMPALRSLAGLQFWLVCGEVARTGQVGTNVILSGDERLVSAELNLRSRF